MLFVAAAALPPGPDIASQLLMPGPLLILYVASIGVAYFFAVPKPAETMDDEADDEPEPG